MVVLQCAYYSVAHHEQPQGVSHYRLVVKQKADVQPQLGDFHDDQNSYFRREMTKTLRDLVATQRESWLMHEIVIEKMISMFQNSTFDSRARGAHYNLARKVYCSIRVEYCS